MIGLFVVEVSFGSAEGSPADNETFSAPCGPPTTRIASSNHLNYFITSSFRRADRRRRASRCG